MPPDSQAAIADQFTPPDVDGYELVATGRLDGDCDDDEGTASAGPAAAVAARCSHAFCGCQVLRRSFWPATIASGLEML